MPYLIQKKPDGSVVKQWELHDKPLTVGRGDDADASIDDKEMSRHHFVISRTADGYVIKDLESTNGTWVNGRGISEQTLRPNDKIRAGQTPFVFVEGLSTVIGKLEKGETGYSTYVRKISEKKSP
jgi:pSer/pThr/pTyr-binding forkhead associated (FHA) protein